LFQDFSGVLIDLSTQLARSVGSIEITDEPSGCSPAQLCLKDEALARQLPAKTKSNRRVRPQAGHVRRGLVACRDLCSRSSHDSLETLVQIASKSGLKSAIQIATTHGKLPAKAIFWGPDMKRIVVGVLAALIAWTALLVLTGIVLSALWPAYAAVRETMTFTLLMMIARLAIGAVTLTLAGYIAGRIAREGRAKAALILGVVLLVIFIPVHVNLWERFPVWYHLTFLLTIVPLSVIGGRLAGAVTAPPAAA
jgi:hypothetical protein